MRPNEGELTAERTVLSLHETSKWYDSTRGVEGLSFSVQEGELLALVGPSGCGKTTTLRLIAGFERPDAGVIRLGGQVVAGPGAFAPPEKRRVSMVFQDYALFPHLTVAENVAFGLVKGERRPERVRELLTLVGLRGMEQRRPHELSGGEQQRVALARALAPRPQVVLLDEPFSNLHANLRAQVRAEVRDILRASGTTAILVTHDQEEALLMGDLIAVQRDGKVEQIDTPERIFHTPASRFVARFMGMADFVGLGRVGGALAQRGPVSAGEVEVMVRPDDLLLEPSDGGTGHVAGRVFQGATYLYEVAIGPALRLHCSMPHTERYPVGTRVAVRLNPAHPPLCFVDGETAGPASHELVAMVQRRLQEGV
ncbi:MAG: ABC transporter ATP-binding protein [Dehalococcoidia bacterium]|nr:ABC transporter ATP-binding protein [Dehalococcoidia bacterium]